VCAGADRARIDNVKAARDQIARALEINPNAHFGRERYQLKAIEWIIDPPNGDGSEFLPNLLGWPVKDEYKTQVDPNAADLAVRGLLGLIVLGNAWESVDVFYALNIALQHDTLGFPRGAEAGRNVLAYYAWRRAYELIDAGSGSMLPGQPRGEPLKARLAGPPLVMQNKWFDETITELRTEADSWQSARSAFMIERMKEGHHPDTDLDFWRGYTERPALRLVTWRSLPPEVTVEPRAHWRPTRRAMILMGGVVWTALLLIIAVRDRRRKAGDARMVGISR
jgi:hypothetical protein